SGLPSSREITTQPAASAAPSVTSSPTQSSAPRGRMLAATWPTKKKRKKSARKMAIRHPALRRSPFSKTRSVSEPALRRSSTKPAVCSGAEELPRAPPHPRGDQGGEQHLHQIG